MATKNEQMLVDIMFQVGLTIASNHYFKDLPQEKVAAWIAEQLALCGVKTVPVGASWGVIRD